MAEQGFPPPGGKKNKRPTREIEHAEFSPAEYRKQANELLEELKTGLETSGIAPAEVGKQWAALKIAHSKLLETTAQYRNARNDEERTTIENSIRSQMAEMRGGDIRENLSEAQQELATARPKQKSSRRHQQRLNKPETLRSADVVGAMERVMKAESDTVLDELDEREDTLRARLVELEDMGEEGEEHKGILKELETIDRKRRSATEAPPVTVPNIKTESVRSGIHADPTPETHKEQVQRLAELSTDQFTAYDQAMKKALGEDESTPASSEAVPALEYDEAARIYQSGGEGYISTPTPTLDYSEAARIYQSGGEGYISTPTAPESPETPAAASPEPEIAPEKPKWNPMEPHPDGQPIVMVNRVLTKQAFGSKKRFEKFEKKYGFPAVPSSKASGTTAELIAARNERLARKEKKKGKGRRWPWLVGAGGLAAISALFIGLGKKEESANVRSVAKPATAEKSAADAGLTLPSLERPTAFGSPSTLTEGTPQALSDWASAQMGQQESAAAKPQAVKKVPRAAAKPKAKTAGASTTEYGAKANLKLSLDRRFNAWEFNDHGRLRSESPVDQLERMSRDEGYSTPYRIDGNSNENLSESTRRPPQAAAPAAPATAEAPTPSRPAESAATPAETGPRRLDTVTDTPGVYRHKKEIIVAGGTPDQQLELAQDYALKHPGSVVKVYEGTGTNTIVHVVAKAGESVTIVPSVPKPKEVPRGRDTVTPVS